MGDQEQQNQSAASGQSQQNQAEGQEQSKGQAQPGAADGAGASQATSQSASAASGQQSDARHTDGGQAGQSTKASQQTETPGIQAGGYKLSLTEAQRKRLLDEGVLDISEEQYTGGVRHQIESLRKRATTAEKKVAETAGGDHRGEYRLVTWLGRFRCSPNRKLTTRTHHRSLLGPLAGKSGRVGQFGQFPRGMRKTGNATLGGAREPRKMVSFLPPSEPVARLQRIPGGMGAPSPLGRRRGQPAGPPSAHERVTL